MKKLLLLLLPCILYVEVNAQETNNRQKVISFQPIPPMIVLMNDILPRAYYRDLPPTISLSYTRVIKKGLEIAVDTKLQYHSSYLSNDEFFIISSKDPFWFYDQFTLRLGLRKYIYKSMYFQPLISYSYGEFSNRWLTYNYQEDERLLSRNSTGLGLGIIHGIARDKNRIRINIFYGIGCNFKNIHEKVIQTKGNNTIEPGNYNYWKAKPVIYGGLEIGYRFGK